MGSVFDFALALGQLMAVHGVDRAGLDNILKQCNGKAGPAKAPARTEASDIEQMITEHQRFPRRHGRPIVTIEAPAESHDYRTLIDHDKEPIDYDKPVLPGLEGTIRPVKVKPKPAVRVKHDTLINKVRFWMLNLPKGSIVTSQ